MWRERKDHARLFLQYFIPFGALVIFVSLLATFWIYSQARETVRREMETQVASSMSTFVDFLDNQMIEMDRISINLSGKNSLRPYNVFLNDYSHVIAYEEFASYVSANSYLDDVFLYYDDSVASRYGQQATIVCNRGMREARFAWESEYAFQELTYSELQQLTQEQRPAFIIPQLSCRSFYPVAERFIVYAVPNGEGSLLLFMLNSSKIEGYFRSRLSYYDGSIQVWDDSGREILFVSCEPERAAEAPADLQPDEVRIVNGNGGVIRAEFYSSLRRLTFCMNWNTVLSDRLFSSALRIHLPFLIAFILSVTFIVVWISGIGFRPIAKVFDSVSLYSQPLTVSFDGMVNSLQEIESRWNSLQYQMERQRKLVHLQLISGLLNGRYTSEEEVGELLTENGIDLGTGSYCVCVVRVRFAQADELREFAVYLERCGLRAGEKRFAVELEEPDTYACILSVPESMDTSEFCKEFYDLIRSGLREEIKCTLGYSSWTDRLCEIAGAYSEANAALRYAFFLGNERAIGIDNVQGGRAQGLVWYPVQEEDMLVHALAIGDTEVALECLGTIEKILMEMHTSVHVARSILLGIIRRVASTLKKGQQGQLEAKLKQTELRLAAPDATLWETIEQLRSITASFCKERVETVFTESESIFHKVDQYLEEAFPNVNLSMNDIAEAFHVSAGYLARIYKQEKGKTVIQTLGEMRLSKAEQLLRETQLSLSDICTECGFVDKGTFIRRFKKQFNVTPIRYRDIYSGKPNSPVVQAEEKEVQYDFTGNLRKTTGRQG